jgi:hypothetical protein
MHRGQDPDNRLLKKGTGGLYQALANCQRFVLNPVPMPMGISALRKAQRRISALFQLVFSSRARRPPAPRRLGR